MSRLKRQKRIRKKIMKVSDRPRLCVFRSNKYIYGQIIDQNGKTIFGLTEKALERQTPRMESAKELGMRLAKIALTKKIKKIVFDKGRYAYHGRVKALAEGAREGGLEF